MNKADELLFAEGPGAVRPEDQRGPWKVLIVDDEEEVHQVTRLVLQHFEFDGRGLEFLHAHSGRQARDILGQRDDIALILLDVVMEDDHAGLALVRHIREEVGNVLSRIVLRTGQPGSAPEHEVISAYDINDYKEKTELTSQKLKTLLYAALRSYRDLLIIEANKRGLEQVIQASTRIFEQREMQRFASAVLTQLTSLLSLDRNAVYCNVKSSGFVAEPAKDRFYITAASGDYAPFVSHYAEDVLPAAVHADLELSLTEQRSLYLDDHYILFFATSAGLKHLLYVAGTRHLTEFDRELVELFSTNVAIAFENLHLNNELEEAQQEMVWLLGEAIESRSNETGSHVKRVAAISHYLAVKAGVGDRKAELIRMASPMHDVGKIGIPDAILNKPGKLDEAEWVIMRDHARLGYEMMRRSQREVFQVAAALAHEHHEHWDGQGYPRGLKGEEISIEGRLTAIADVTDALLSVRCYKSAWSAEDALAFLVSERGRKFDPALIDLVEANFQEILDLRNAHPD